MYVAADGLVAGRLRPPTLHARAVPGLVAVMPYQTVPVVRCPRPYCRGWVERRVLEPLESLGTEAYVCGHCGFAFENLHGRLEPVTRRPQASDVARITRPPVFTGQPRGKGRPRQMEVDG